MLHYNWDFEHIRIKTKKKEKKTGKLSDDNLFYFFSKLQTVFTTNILKTHNQIVTVWLSNNY
jgi:hypothetical protein